MCKTSPKLLGEDNSPFQKAYCVLDLGKMHMLLCDSTNGKVIETIPLADRLCYIDTSLTNKIDQNRNHPMGERGILEELQMPLTYSLPFALFFNDAEMMLFWASTLAEYTKWKRVFKKLIPSKDH